MSWIPAIVESSVPIFLIVALAAAGIWFVLKLFFSFLEIPNYTTASPSPFYRWWHLAPADILFRLASLVALNLALYWMPIYYWTTYQPCGDERDGGVLGASMIVSPLTWILGGVCYGQVWKCQISPQYLIPFRIGSTLLLLGVLSTLLPQVLLYV